MDWKSLFHTKSIQQITSEVSRHEKNEGGLKKALGVWDLTSLGIAAIIGAGIFSTIGNAAYHGGPAVIFLFIFTGIACGFSALCYAEFASAIPVAGSAYTYAYASFGELLAWIIGWDLLMEYAISNIVVAISWSEYFLNLIGRYGVTLPRYFTMDFMSAYRGYEQVSSLIQPGQSLSTIVSSGIPAQTVQAYQAWLAAPRVLGLPIVCNLPVLLITALITWITYIGIRESKRTSNILVALKIAVILMIIFVGGFYIHPGNWVPFAPNGIGGVLKGVSSVFFAYIGFDAISTTAEECKQPQKDLPRGMMNSLVICTVLYVIIALILTGMVSYQKLAVGDPLAFVFGPEGVNIPWISGVVAAIGVVALATVLLVFQIGQPRIWMAMSRDGLLPPIFSAIHPKYKTPWFSTLLTGVFVAVPSLFMNLNEVADLTSIGTLFAFAIVCGGSIRMRNSPLAQFQKYRVPYINSKYIFPILTLVGVALVSVFNWDGVLRFITAQEISHRVPMVVFCIEVGLLCIFCYRKSLPLIPVLGLTTCSYLITELGVTNWIRFGVWLAIGLSVYFLYGFKHSRLRASATNSELANLSTRKMLKNEL